MALVQCIKGEILPLVGKKSEALATTRLKSTKTTLGKSISKNK